MPKPKPKPESPDDNARVVRAIDELTYSEPVNGEDLLGSEKLKRQYRAAKERIDAEQKKR